MGDGPGAPASQTWIASCSLFSFSPASPSGPSLRSLKSISMIQSSMWTSASTRPSAPVSLTGNLSQTKCRKPTTNVSAPTTTSTSWRRTATGRTGTGTGCRMNSTRRRPASIGPWDGMTGADTIKADLAGLEAGMGAEFGENVDKCAAWSGDFSSARVRREAGQEAEQVPQLFEGGARSLGWLKSLVRKTRSADKDERAKKGNNKGKGKGKSQGKSRGKKAERQTNRQLARKDQKESGRKSGNKRPNGPAKKKK